MSKIVSSIITSLNRKVSPGNVNQSKDIFGVLEEGSDNLLTEIKPKDLSKRIIIENALYDQVERFHCPDDLDQKLVMQVYRLKGQQNIDTFYNPVFQATNRRFDQHRIGDKNMITVEWDQGVKYLKLSDMNQSANGIINSNDGLTIHTMNSINENGLWTSFGNVTDLYTDTLTYIAGTGSLRFTINPSSNTGGIENRTLKPFSLVEFLTVGKIFTWLDIPNVNQIQTVTLEMYSSAGNGYSITVNGPHDTNDFQLGPNMMGFILDPSNMRTIGNPDPANLNHVKFTFVSNGTLLMNNVRMDNIVARKGTVYGIQYISQFMFKDKNGLFKQYATETTDELILGPEAARLYADQCAVVLGQEIFTDTMMNKKGQIFGKIGQMQNKLAADYKQYKRNYKAEFIDEQQDPYVFGVLYGYNNRGKWSGNRFDHTNEMGN